jgi:hypothetical protein
MNTACSPLATSTDRRQLHTPGMHQLSTQMLLDTSDCDSEQPHKTTSASTLARMPRRNTRTRTMATSTGGGLSPWTRPHMHSTRQQQQQTIKNGMQTKAHWGGPVARVRCMIRHPRGLAFKTTMTVRALDFICRGENWQPRCSLAGAHNHACIVSPTRCHPRDACMHEVITHCRLHLHIGRIRERSMLCSCTPVLS